MGLGEYGTVCTVSAPDPLTQVQTSQCGITLGSLTTPIYADAVSGATRYRFQVTRGSEVRGVHHKFGFYTLL